ncbi:MAG TPA: hypothetical protein VJ463_02540, partial [Geothrix sp.]|nr:hypothetical protein [Geothrix sp.]
MVAQSLPHPPPIALQSFLAGLLVALAVLALLACRPLRDEALRLAGLLGLTASAAWIAFSGIAAAFLPGTPASTLHHAALLLAGLGLILWDRVVSSLLLTSPGPPRLALARRLAALGSLAAALAGTLTAALLPERFSPALPEVLFGLLASLLALLTLAAGLRARRQGLGAWRVLVAAALALLAGCTSRWGLAAGRISAPLGLAILEAALALLAVALGGATLGRMADLGQASEAAQADAARQAQD